MSSLAIELSSNVLVVCGRLIAGTTARMQSGPGEVKVLMGIEQDAAGAADAQHARPGIVPVFPSEAEVEQHELTHLPSRSWCGHCVRAKGKESPHHESSPCGVSKFATDSMFMGEDGTPITILAGYDGLTKALQRHESGLRRKSTCAQLVVHRSSESDTAERSRTEPHRRQTPSWNAHPNRNRTKKVQSETATPTVALSKRTKSSKDRFVESRTTLNDRSVRRLVSAAQF